MPYRFAAKPRSATRYRRPIAADKNCLYMHRQALPQSGKIYFWRLNAVVPVDSYPRLSMRARPLQDSIERFEVLFIYLVR